MTTDTPAPRFTADDYEKAAQQMARWRDKSGDKNVWYQKMASMHRQAAADLAAAPTRDELIGALRKMNGWNGGLLADATEFADYLIKAGVRVRA